MTDNSYSYRQKKHSLGIAQISENKNKFTQLGVEARNIMQAKTSCLLGTSPEKTEPKIQELVRNLVCTKYIQYTVQNTNIHH